MGLPPCPPDFRVQREGDVVGVAVRDLRAEPPTSVPDLYVTDTSSAAAECITLTIAVGAVLHLFPTEQGYTIGPRSSL